MRTLPIQGLTIKGLGKKDLPFSELKMDVSKAAFVGATLGWIPMYFLSRNEKNWKIKQSKRWKKRDSNPVPTLDLCAWPIGRPFVDILHWQNFSLYQQSQDDYLVWQQLLHSLSRGLFNKALQIRKLWIYSYGQILTVNLLIISKNSIIYGHFAVNYVEKVYWNRPQVQERMMSAYANMHLIKAIRL